MKVGLVSILRNRRYRLRTSWLAYKSGPPFRGVTGAFLDLEYQRIELLKFNLFDNSGTYKDYITGRGGVGGQALKRWDELRLPKTSPYYAAVGGDGVQTRSGDLICARTLTGICNDVVNPAMGSTGRQDRPFLRGAGHAAWNLQSR